MKYPESINLLRQRLTESDTDPMAAPNVADGIRALIDKELSSASMRENRRLMLSDLQAKATEAEATHDPIIIQNLLTALTAFLAEEMAETGDADDTDAGDGTPDDLAPPTESVDAATDGEQYEMDDGDIVAPEDARAAEDEAAASEEETGAEPYEESDTGVDYFCEACGYEGKMKLRESSHAANGEAEGDKDMAKEQAEKATPGSDVGALAQQIESQKAEIATLKADLTRMRESVKPIADAVPGNVKEMIEADRMELAQLRISERQRQLATKAHESIGAYATESGIPEALMRECVKVEDLTPFAESQWPTILGLAGRNIEAPREFVGATEPNMPAPRVRVQTKRESAADFVRAQYGGTALKESEGDAK